MSSCVVVPVIIDFRNHPDCMVGRVSPGARGFDVVLKREHAMTREQFGLTFGNCAFVVTEMISAELITKATIISFSPETAAMGNLLKDREEKLAALTRICGDKDIEIDRLNQVIVGLRKELSETRGPA